MTWRQKGIIVFALLLTSIAGCGDKTPSSTTPTQTNTPSSPVASPQASTSPSDTPTAAGFKKLQGNGVELSLPETFEGGNPSTDLDAIYSKLNAINPNYAKRLEALKKNPSAISLIAFDTKETKPGFLTNVNVLPEKVPPGTTIEQYLAAATKQLSGQYKIIDQKIVPLGSYQAGRVVAESSRGATKIKQLFYIVPKDNNVWLVTYSTLAEEFDRRLPGFEQSARTFTIE